jgi:hypothetical protein
MINQEQYIEHEVQIRLHDERFKIQDDRFKIHEQEMKDIRLDIKNEIKEIHKKIDSHFIWIVGLIFVSIVIPVLLHSLDLT